MADITTVVKVKQYLKITSADYDTILGEFIKRVTTRIETYIGRKVASIEITEYHDGDGTATFITKFKPIVSITSIHDDPDRDYGSGTLISSDDYIFTADTGEVRLVESAFNKNYQNIKIVYNAGWATVPEDLEDVAVEMVARMFANSKEGSNDLGVTSRKEGESSTSINTEDFLPGHQKILDAYQVIST